MAADKPGVVFVPWYATGLRADRLEPALAKVAAVVMRYGATQYSVFRSRDDRYRFLQISHFNSKLEWERYWYGPEMAQFRADYSSWYQIPLVYEWNDLVAADVVEPEVDAEVEEPATAESA
jgi:quinol monooxygenase YgiN